MRRLAGVGPDDRIRALKLIRELPEHPTFLWCDSRGAVLFYCPAREPAWRARALVRWWFEGPGWPSPPARAILESL